MRVSIGRIESLEPALLQAMLVESRQAGVRFVQRLVEEWSAGANRFDRPGELLLEAIFEQQIVGICGLNVDPYATAAGVGRVRHLYVCAEYRRRGIGRRLVEAVMAAARPSFRRLRLRTDNPEAALFYESLGFEPRVGDAACTHVLALHGTSFA